MRDEQTAEDELAALAFEGLDSGEPTETRSQVLGRQALKAR
jgi:hypothetical protein